ncbi:hypothetical protein [Paenibacillus sp. XY044]|nr:hypothetical protein [Paenibacillus sp. XY044]
MKATMTIGPMAEQIKKTILKDFGNNKKADYVKLMTKLPKVVNQ